MLAEFPVATNNGAPIVGYSREEMIFGHTDSPAVLPLTYPAYSLDQSNATLTVRLYEADARMPVPAERWRYVSPRQIAIDLVEGFDAGAIYEFIYPASDPIVMGLGFVAVRDFVTYMRSNEPDTADQPHPLSPDPGAPAIDHVIAYGRSQPGRFLREFVPPGFQPGYEWRPGLRWHLCQYRRVTAYFLERTVCAAGSLSPPPGRPSVSGRSVSVQLCDTDGFGQ